ncbi:putative cholesterol esterase [Gordonia hirsuta DSM 44140 = NBRC 16056]|uniref:Putative cholesterol esterase n=1 Tax=Gordonia hirsuta DSM 44140 = NBRC 16056 TaxID=1121927 RepID=L7L8Q0_9ACTN|nr:DUF6230 family protein [Gordonia hirsuta]GAC56427.1 putative cholesterol esterase [Gordonia hirsuta DSM 44140 = NBRC 16056]
MKAKQKKTKRVRQTRPKIFVPALILGLGVTTAMGVGMVRGDVPVQMAVSGENFQATLSSLEGTDVAVYPRAIETTRNGRIETVVVTMGTATLTDLCLAMSAPNLPGVGTVTMVIKAPGPSTKAIDMMMDVDGLGASMTLTNAVVGSAQAAVDSESSELATAIAAPSASILDVGADVQAMRAAKLTVDGAKVSLSREANPCGGVASGDSGGGN